MKFRLHLWFTALALLLGAMLLISPHVEAQSKTLRWRRWDVDIRINSDGTFTVQEVYEIEFIGGDFTFGFRNIPIRQFVRLQDIRVREGGIEYIQAYSEVPHTYYVNQDSSEYVINFFYPPTRDATRVFTVQYTVVGGIIISEEVGDRFFWKAVGPEHAFPIESSTVIVRMPPGATVDTTIEPAMFGVSDGSYVVSSDLTYVTFQATNIPVNQEFEVGVRFPHGFIPNEKPPWQEEYEREQAWNDTGRPILNLLFGGLGMLLLFGGPLSIYLLWLTRGRDPDVGPVPSYLAEPPSKLPPGIAGTLLDEKADLQDIIATLVDLARRGVIEMEEREKKIFGLTTSKEFVFRKKPDAQEGLLGYEKLLLQQMFGSRDEVELDDLREKFYTAIPKIQAELYERAVEEEFFPANPKAVRGRYTGLGIAGIVLSIGVGFCALGALGDKAETIICPFISLGVTSIVLIAVGQVMPVKSRKGAEEAAKWKAFKTYLLNAERYADLKEKTDQFDRYLPYAIAFGLERVWINKFLRIPNTPIPPWYIPVGGPYYHGAPHTGRAMRPRMLGEETARGAGRDLRSEQARPSPSLDSLSDQMFGGLNSISSGLFSMLNSASTAMISTPHSSGGGFSGGGFSGGGGGGGGGAGFG